MNADFTSILKTLNSLKHENVKNILIASILEIGETFIENQYLPLVRTRCKQI